MQISHSKVDTFLYWLLWLIPSSVFLWHFLASVIFCLWCSCTQVWYHYLRYLQYTAVHANWQAVHVNCTIGPQAVHWIRQNIDCAYHLPQLGLGKHFLSGNGNLYAKCQSTEHRFNGNTCLTASNESLTCQLKGRKTRLCQHTIITD